MGSRTVGNYLKEMRTSGVWGDNIMLESLSRAYQVPIAVFKKLENGSYLWMEAGENPGNNVRMPLYLEGEHYENMVTLREVYG